MASLTTTAVAGERGYRMDRTSGIAANSMAAAKKYRGFQAMDRFSSEWGVSLV